MLIGVVGVGKMASAIIRGLSFDHRDQNDNPQLYLYDICSEAYSSFDSSDKIHIVSSLDDLHYCDVILLSIKPQTFLQEFSTFQCLPPSALFVSIMAGIRIDALQQLHPHHPMRTIRVMPNLPIQYNEGMGVYVSHPNCQNSDIEALHLLLGSSSRLLSVDNENLIDALTIVVGSGPAYLFQLASDLYDFTIQHGLPEEDARRIVIQTLFGSATYLKENSSDFKELIRSVMSPGGTTEAVFDHFKKCGLSDIMSQSFEAGYQRSIGLNKRG